MHTLIFLALFFCTVFSTSLDVFEGTSFRGTWNSTNEGTFSFTLYSQSVKLKTPSLSILYGFFWFRVGKYSTSNDIRIDSIGLYNSSSNNALLIGSPRMTGFTLDFKKLETHFNNSLYLSSDFFNELVHSTYPSTSPPCLSLIDLNFLSIDPHDSSTPDSSIKGTGFLRNFTLTNPRLCPNLPQLFPLSSMSFNESSKLLFDRKMSFYTILSFFSTLLILIKPVAFSTQRRWLPLYHRLVTKQRRSSRSYNTITDSQEQTEDSNVNYTDIVANLFGLIPTWSSLSLVAVDFCLFVFNLTWALVLESFVAVPLALSGLLLFCSISYLDKSSIFSRSRSRNPNSNRSMVSIIPIAMLSMLLFASGYAYVVLVLASHLYLLMFFEIIITKSGKSPCLFFNISSAVGRLLIPSYFLLYPDNFLLLEPVPYLFAVILLIVLIGITLLSLSRLKGSIISEIFKKINSSGHDPLQLPQEIINSIRSENSQDEIECPICLEPITPSHLDSFTFVYTKCHHLYHDACLVRFTSDSSRPHCCVCRAPI
ncbi:hypothetical protein RCL1_000241 [Eukaryota sp. TZLM3-RCL]